MPLPLLGWAAAAGASALIGKFVYDEGKNSGYNDGKEIGSSVSQKLTRNLAEMQKQRESLKDEFKEILNNIEDIDINSETFLSRSMSLFRGYTYFHVFVLSCITYTKYECLDKSLDKKDSEELKDRVLGLVQAGYPEKIKADIAVIWEESNISIVEYKLSKSIKKLPKELKKELEVVSIKIQKLIINFIDLKEKEDEINHQLRLIKTA